MGTLCQSKEKRESMSTLPSSQTFHLKRRGYQIAQGLIFLVFGGSCVYQSILRYGVEVDKFWNSWWFFALLSLGFLYLTAEAFYKVIFARLVFTPDEVIQYDFPKAMRTPWSDIERVGEIRFKDKKNDFGMMLKDSALEKDGLLAIPVISLTPYFSSWNESPIKKWLKENKAYLLK
jgi:hypothetical protein